MIQNDVQPDVVREQLARAEAALESLRREVQPKNEQTYSLMAELRLGLNLDSPGDKPGRVCF